MNELALPEVICYHVSMATVTATLRTALQRCGESRYMVSRATGIPQSVLSRFAHGQSLRGANIDRLCDYLGLALTKQPAKRGEGR